MHGRDPGRDNDAAYRARIEPFTREAMMDLHLKYALWVEKAPKFNKATRRFQCGAKECEAAYKSINELERHYVEVHKGE